jgi:serine/threonine protein kinase
MEFMEEGSLEKVIDAFPRIKMTEKQIAYVCFEILKALEYIHGLHRIHRDIKVLAPTPPPSRQELSC